MNDHYHLMRGTQMSHMSDLTENPSMKSTKSRTVAHFLNTLTKRVELNLKELDLAYSTLTTLDQIILSKEAENEEIAEYRAASILADNLIPKCSKLIKLMQQKIEVIESNPTEMMVNPELEKQERLVEKLSKIFEERIYLFSLTESTRKAILGDSDFMKKADLVSSSSKKNSSGFSSSTIYIKNSQLRPTKMSIRSKQSTKHVVPEALIYDQQEHANKREVTIEELKRDSRKINLLADHILEKAKEQDRKLDNTLLRVSEQHVVIQSIDNSFRKSNEQLISGAYDSQSMISETPEKEAIRRESIRNKKLRIKNIFLSILLLVAVGVIVFLLKRDGIL